MSENLMREAMHPADEYDGFKKLTDEGQGPETVAAKFNVTTTYVKQRMKLASVSPKLMALFRKDEINLDQMMAVTLTDDQKTQWKVWQELPEWAKEGGNDNQIRAALTKEQASADSKEGKCVGLETYKAAGGAINQDLFAEDGEGWLTDTDLLSRIVEEKLSSVAETVKAEGWKWVRHAPSFPYEETSKDGRLMPNYAPITDDAHKQMEA